MKEVVDVSIRIGGFPIEIETQISLFLVSISIGNLPYEYKQQEANIPYCSNSSEKIESQQISMSQQMVFFFSF